MTPVKIPTNKGLESGRDALSSNAETDAEIAGEAATPFSKPVAA
jgi:hypothetical protein